MPSYSKYSRHLPQFKVVEKFFSSEEIDQITALESQNELSEGTLIHGRIDKIHRDCEVFWLEPEEKTKWLFDKFGFLLGEVNHDVFMYDIDGFENFQYTKYSESQHYNWHIDYNWQFAKWKRKISATVMLSDPNEYTGGEFEIVNNGNIEDIKSFKPNKGDIIFFASWMPHRVKPITTGIRRSLVTWVMGVRKC